MVMDTESKYSIYKFAGKRITANDLRKISIDEYRVFMDTDDIIRFEKIDTMGTLRRIELYYYEDGCSENGDDFRVWTWYQTREEIPSDLAPKHAASLSKYELQRILEIQQYFGL